jgi:hypothetical protein
MNATDTTVEEQFAVGEDCELSVGNISGRVSIRAGDAGVISMRAVKRGRDSAVENTEIETSQDGNRVRIRTRGLENGVFGLKRSVCSVDYDIAVPLGCAVEAKTVSADATVIGIGGSLRLDTVSGDAEVEDVRGSCDLHTVSGDVLARRVEAPVTIRTTSGDINVRSSSLPSLNAHSVSGDITVESPLHPEAQYYGKTVSGDVTLIVPGDTGASISLRSVSGRFESSFQGSVVDVIRPGRRNWQGLINGGGAQVEMQSVSGNLRLRASSPIPQPPSQEERDAAVNEALTALERGEITVEEAMARIKGQR